MNLLEVLGFSQQQDIISHDDGLQMLMVISQQDVLDQHHKLSKVAEMIAQMSTAKSIKSLTTHFDRKSPGKALIKPPMSRAQKDQKIGKMANSS